LLIAPAREPDVLPAALRAVVGLAWRLVEPVFACLDFVAIAVISIKELGASSIHSLNGAFHPDGV
jgi:hypothetical protein